MSCRSHSWIDASRFVFVFLCLCGESAVMTEGRSIRGQNGFDFNGPTLSLAHLPRFFPRLLRGGFGFVAAGFRAGFEWSALRGFVVCGRVGSDDSERLRSSSRRSRSTRATRTSIRSPSR